jgi:hypothetical protein
MARTLLGVALAACLVLMPFNGPLAQKVEYDSGPIESMPEDHIVVRGNLGTTVLEPIRDCLWCEVGLEVLITFRGLMKASLRPFADPDNKRAITAFIVKDGRESGK